MAKEKQVAKGNLDDILGQIKKDYGEGVVSLGSDELGNLGVIPFGILSLDRVTGIGGLGRGRCHDLHGMDGTFKTTLALSLVAEEQKIGGKCAFIDAEYAFSPEYAETLGVNTEELILIHPASMEEAYTIIEKLVQSKEVSLIVLDSATSLSPSAELANDFGASNMGVIARLNGQFYRKITAQLGKAGSTLVILNQLREALGGYVPMKTVPGGNAVRFFSSMRFEITKSAIKEGTDIKGVTLKVKCVKNKLAIPYLYTELECIYGQGIDKLKDLIGVACDEGIINKQGAGWMSYKDYKVQGVDNLKQLLVDNEELRLEIEELVKAKING